MLDNSVLQDQFAVYIRNTVTGAALVHQLIEVRDEKRLLRLRKQMLAPKVLIIDELGFVPLSKTGAELLFELVSQRYGLQVDDVSQEEVEENIRSGAPAGNHSRG